jgi:mRNA interferase RelE/StbE
MISPTALESLEAVSDRRIRALILKRVDALSQNPRMQGKILHGALAGLLSLRAARQRYRVLYQVDDKDQRVIVRLVGIRKEGSREDIYVLAQRLLRRGFF